MTDEGGAETSVRIDVWLWRARFFRTRALSASHVRKSGVRLSHSGQVRRTDKPEFDAWRWHDYWAPTQDVVEFKRPVYEQALNELSRYLVRGAGVSPARRALRRGGAVRMPGPG